ncbi:hypothetical protein ACP6PL_10815 [Dapis sp. BLCC M126]|uniref:hypothetical protein n=1 Tax=Dapis sp. BLCC M126 TaxID=3400189 RepID=UPI003CECAB1E
MNLSIVKRHLKEIRNYGLYFLQKRSLPSNKFVIFGRGRSGSTLLVNLLSNQNQVHCDNEILHDRLLFPRTYIDLCSSHYESSVYGFKLLSYQVRDVQPISKPENFLLSLYESGYKFIYLTRSNLVDHALSNINAKHKQKYHHRSHEGELEYKPIKVEIEEVFQRIQFSEELGKYEKKLLQKIPHLSLTYEDNLLDSECHQKTVDQVLELFNLPSKPVKTNLVKLMPLELSKMVENYEELIEAIQKSKYADFIRDNTSKSKQQV